MEIPELNMLIKARMNDIERRSKGEEEARRMEKAIKKGKI